MRPLPPADALPWYRQFWPWFLIMLPASVVVAGLSTVYIASRHADDLVVDDYYKEGLAINRQLQKKHLADELQLSARLQFGPGNVTVHLSGPVDDPALRLSLSHPLEADRDFTVSLSRVGPGLYRGTLEHSIAPRWHWTLESQHENRWRLDGAIQPSEVSHATGS